MLEFDVILKRKKVISCVFFFFRLLVILSFRLRDIFAGLGPPQFLEIRKTTRENTLKKNVMWINRSGTRNFEHRQFFTTQKNQLRP